MDARKYWDIIQYHQHYEEITTYNNGIKHDNIHILPLFMPEKKIAFKNKGR